MNRINSPGIYAMVTLRSFGVNAGFTYNQAWYVATGIVAVIAQH